MHVRYKLHLTPEPLRHLLIYLLSVEDKIQKRSLGQVPCHICSSCFPSPCTTKGIACLGIIWELMEKRPMLGVDYPLSPPGTPCPAQSPQSAAISNSITIRILSSVFLWEASLGKQVLSSVLADLSPLRPLAPWLPCNLCSPVLKNSNAHGKLCRFLLPCVKVRGYALFVLEFCLY